MKLLKSGAQCAPSNGFFMQSGDKATLVIFLSCFIAIFAAAAVTWVCAIRFEEKFFSDRQNHPKFHHRRGSREMKPRFIKIKVIRFIFSESLILFRHWQIISWNGIIWSTFVYIFRKFVMGHALCSKNEMETYFLWSNCKSSSTFKNFFHYSKQGSRRSVLSMSRVKFFN